MSLDNPRGLPEHLDCWIVSRTPQMNEALTEKYEGPTAEYIVWGVADDEVAKITVHCGSHDETPPGGYGSSQYQRDNIARHMALGPQAIDALRHLVRQVESGGPVDLTEAKRLIGESKREVL